MYPEILEARRVTADKSMTLCPPGTAPAILTIPYSPFLTPIHPSIDLRSFYLPRPTICLIQANLINSQRFTFTSITSHMSVSSSELPSEHYFSLLLVTFLRCVTGSSVFMCPTQGSYLIPSAQYMGDA